MAYPNWLKIAPKKKADIQVGKVRPESIADGEMAAASPAAASEKLARIIEQRDAIAKILVVGDGAFSAKLTDYAIKMAQRLDCELVALSIFEKPGQEQRGPGESEKAHFMRRSELGAAAFADKAGSGGVKFHQLARIGVRAAVIEQVGREIAGIRYVLSEPEDDKAAPDSGYLQLPVIDTTSR